MEDTFELGSNATNNRIKNEQGSPVTERGWDSYRYIFDFTSESKSYWNGKKLLDVGSGIKYQDTNITFPGATVCAIDPEFEEKGTLPFTRIPNNTAKEKRTGVVQEIPYDDNMFDHVVSSHAVPQHILPVDMPKAVSEMLRVIGPGGDVRLAPCVELDLPMKELIEAGLVVDLGRPTTEGKLAIISFPETIRLEKDPVKQLREKVDVWKKFHLLAVRGDPLRLDFDSLEYAKSNASKLLNRA